MARTVDEAELEQGEDSQLSSRFRRLVQEWKAERDPYSSRPDEWAMCWSYQKIIAMGPPVIPLILAELRTEPDHWFWALSALTEVDPVPPDKRGQFSEMTKAWLTWGEQHGGIVLS
jgi:hypothetical protein